MYVCFAEFLAFFFCDLYFVALAFLLFLVCIPFPCRLWYCCWQLFTISFVATKNITFKGGWDYWRAWVGRTRAAFSYVCKWRRYFYWNLSECLNVSILLYARMLLRVKLSFALRFFCCSWWPKVMLKHKFELWLEICWICRNIFQGKIWRNNIILFIPYEKKTRVWILSFLNLLNRSLKLYMNQNIKRKRKKVWNSWVFRHIWLCSPSSESSDFCQICSVLLYNFFPLL